MQGLVTAADGVTRIGQATVGLSSGSLPTTTTDSQGAYTLANVPAGAQNLKATKGNFSAVFAVTVSANTTVTAPPAKLVSSGKLAYVPGYFDSIESIVRDQLGNPMDALVAAQLGTASTIAQYRMIFLNCGLDDAPAFQPATITTLLSWVRSGGTLYASDWAISYVSRLLPSDFLVTETSGSQTITASVSDSDLQAFIGKSTAQIRYDLPGWYGLKQVSSRPRVLLRGNYISDVGAVTNRPLAVVVNEGSGKIVYTTFHNEAGVTSDQIAVLRYFVYIE